MALFAGVFDGESDEVNFAALGQPTFLGGVRELIGEERPQAPVAIPVEALPPKVEEPASLLAAGVQILQAFAEWKGELPWTPELKERAVNALRRLLEQAEED